MSAEGQKQTSAPPLHKALVAAGQPWLAAVPLVCCEWHQRPENVLAGHLAWTDYRPAERPDWVPIVHHKTNERVWLPPQGCQRFAVSRADHLPRRACACSAGGRGVLSSWQRRAEGARPSPRSEVSADARATAGLGDPVTLAACRHGGLTELGDAELTEQGVMALSGHRTPDAVRLYVKRTEAQRAAGARRRRAWIESQVA